VLVLCLAKLRIYRVNLLAHFWIDRVLLLSDCWHSKADCQPRKG
jgi:hypothetical protein